MVKAIVETHVVIAICVFSTVIQLDFICFGGGGKLCECLCYGKFAFQSQKKNIYIFDDLII